MEENNVITEAAATAKEILRQAKIEAKRIVQEAKNSLPDEGAAEKMPRGIPVTQASDIPEVEIELFGDSGLYSEPVAVKWGGRQFLIPRGVRVRVPAPVAEIIRISEKQDHNAAALIRHLEASARI